MGKTVRKKISPKRFAECLVRGGTIEEAALKAGYSQTVAKRGKAGVSRQCWAEYRKQLDKRLDELKALGRSLTPAEQEELVRGKLTMNVVEGKDEAAQSLKMLGQDKRVAMFTPDSMNGFVVIQAPRDLPTLPSQLPDASDEHDDAALRHRFFSQSSEDQLWRASPDGHEAKLRLEAKGLL